MGTTANGLPWPDGDDYLVDGDDAIKALAEAVDRTYSVAFADATLTSAGIATGRTGWGINSQNADPSGRLAIGANGISAVVGGVVLVQFSPILSTPGQVTYGIALNNPNTGPIYASTVYTPGGPGTRISGEWLLAAGSSFHPVFLGSTSGSTCTGGYFEVRHHGPRAAA